MKCQGGGGGCTGGGEAEVIRILYNYSWFHLKAFEG